MIEDELLKTLPVLGYRTEGMYHKYKNNIRDYDLLIFTHPAPHANKAYKDPSWRKCYDVNVPTMGIFHDPLAESHYAWIRKCEMDYAVSVQPKGIISMQLLPKNVKKLQSYHPMNLTEGIFNDFNYKNNSLIAPHQFKSWKRMDVVVRAVPKMNKKINVFGLGTEFYYMQRCSYPNMKSDSGREPSKATLILRGWIEAGQPRMKKRPMIIKQFEKYGDSWKRALDTNMTHHKIVPRRDLIRFFKKSVGVIDMSLGEHGKKYKKKFPNFSSQNYSLLEGIQYGAIPIVSEYSVQAPFDRECFIVVAEKDIVNGLAKACNFEFNDEIKGKILRNQIKLKKHFDRKKVVKSYIDLVEGKIEPQTEFDILGSGGGMMSYV